MESAAMMVMANIKKMSQETRDAYHDKVKAKLDEWDSTLDAYRAKARQAEADARIEIEKQIEDLETKRKEARKRLEEIQNANEHVWDDLSDGLGKIVDDIEETLSSIGKRFK